MSTPQTKPIDRLKAFHAMAAKALSFTDGIQTMARIILRDFRSDADKDAALIAECKRQIIEAVNEHIEVSTEDNEDGFYGCIYEQTVKRSKREPWIEVDGEAIAGWDLMRANDDTGVNGAVNNGWLKWSGSVTEIGREAGVVRLKVDVGGEES